jgi:hypothetical protein
LRPAAGSPSERRGLQSFHAPKEDSIVRHLVVIFAFAFALALPGMALAGEGCPYSKSAPVTASTDEAAPADHAGACSASCPHAQAAAAGACSCGAAQKGQTVESPSSEPATTPGPVAATQ